MDMDYLFSLISTPFGLATLALIVCGWINAKFDFKKPLKVMLPWGLGILLSIAMWLLGKYANFGVYALYEFNTFKDWAVFALVCLSPGLISNGIYDSKVLHWLLSLLGAARVEQPNNMQNMYR